MTRNKEKQEFQVFLTGLFAYAKKQNRWFGKPLGNPETWHSLSDVQKDESLAQALSSMHQWQIEEIVKRARKEIRGGQKEQA